MTRQACFRMPGHGPGMAKRPRCRQAWRDIAIEPSDQIVRRALSPAAPYSEQALSGPGPLAVWSMVLPKSLSLDATPFHRTNDYQGGAWM